MNAGYTGLPAEHREAYEAQMASHERAYKDVREHALAGADRDFDKPLEAGEREHQKHLRENAGLAHKDVLRIRNELRNPTRRTGPASPGRRGRKPANPSLAGPRAARTAARAAGGTIGAAASGTGSIVMQLIGMVFLLSLVYLLVSGKGVSAVTGATNLVVGGVRAFIAPVDPIASLETALGAAPPGSQGSASSSSSSSSSSTGAIAPSSLTPQQSAGPSSQAPLGGRVAVAPNKIALPRPANKWGIPTSLLQADLTLRAANAKLINAHRLTPAQAHSREEHLIPRAKYPAFYGH
jgi:hypothetical protein